MPELLLELLSEEIPARMQAAAAVQLERLMSDALKEAGLETKNVKAYVTPRRLALVIPDLPLATADVREERKGPRVGAGRDKKQTDKIFWKQMSLGVNAPVRLTRRVHRDVCFLFARRPCVSGCWSGPAAWLHITVCGLAPAASPAAADF